MDPIELPPDPATPNEPSKDSPQESLPVEAPSQSSPAQLPTESAAEPSAAPAGLPAGPLPPPPPPAGIPVLQKLSTPPFPKGKFPLVGILASIYDHVTTSTKRY